MSKEILIKDCPVYLESQGKKYNPYISTKEYPCEVCPFKNRQCIDRVWQSMSKENTLRERIEGLTLPYIESCGFSGRDLIARNKVLSHQILNLLNSELEGLTVIGDEEIQAEFKLLEDTYADVNMPWFWAKAVSKAQLSHTIKELKERYGINKTMPKS